MIFYFFANCKGIWGDFLIILNLQENKEILRETFSFVWPTCCIWHLFSIYFKIKYKHKNIKEGQGLPTQTSAARCPDDKYSGNKASLLVNGEPSDEG